MLYQAELHPACDLLTSIGQIGTRTGRPELKVLIIRAMRGSFATVLNCMDGRIQVPVILHLLDRFGVEYIDTITEAGIVRCLSDEIDSPQTESTLYSILISIEKHGSRQIAIVAHDDCAGNPIPAEMQQDQVRVSVMWLNEHFPHCEILGLWADADLQIQEIAQA